jgi:hypothetical protein
MMQNYGFSLSGLFIGILIAVSPFQFVSSQLLSQVCISNNPDDIDGDGILNKWELEGIDINSDNKIDLNLAALGASPVYKDLFLEIDYMKYHKPYSSVIPNVIREFEDAPVCNPDGSKGINLHIELDDQIDNHKDSIIVFEKINGEWKETWRGFDEIKNVYFGNITQRSDDDNSMNILAAKRQVYHYGLFGHTFDNRPNSGISRGIPAMDFIVSLGYNNWPIHPTTQHHVGTPDLQEGTLMHEFGHNLGLFHGGNDHNNSKANYFSVMNYDFQFSSKIDNRRLDYSECALPPIDENNLIERLGIGGQSCPPELLTFINCPPSIETAGFAVDWNGDNDYDDTNIKRDINCDGKYTQLISYDDWNNLKYITTVNEGESNLLGIPEEEGGNVTDYPPNEYNITTFYNNNTLYGQEFDEMTMDDVKQQIIDRTIVTDNAINKTSQNDVGPPTSLLGSIARAGLEEEVVANEIKDEYRQVLGVSNQSYSYNGTLPEKENNVRDLITSDNIDAAISTLNRTLSTMDSVRGGSPDDDVIKNPSDQLRIGSLIDGSIRNLKSITCTYSNCVTDNQTSGMP